MRKIIFILFLFILSTGCRTTKKATKSNIQAKIETVTKTESKVADVAKEEKNLNVETITTITETVYNEPDSVAKTNTPTQTPTDIKGSVKSTKTTTIKTVQIDKGKVETEHKADTKTDVAKKEDTKAKVETTEKKTHPIQWWAIFGILVLAVGVFIYIKKRLS